MKSSKYLVKMSLWGFIGPDHFETVQTNPIAAATAFMNWMADRYHLNIVEKTAILNNNLIDVLRREDGEEFQYCVVFRVNGGGQPFHLEQVIKD